MDTPKAIYIGGHGRSGTTITDRVLAKITGGFSMGEIHRFWAYGLARDWKCSCGKALRNCDFWGPIVQQSFSESGCSEEEILEAWQTVARPKSLISLQYPRFRSDRFQRRLAKYRSFLSTLYRNVSERTGKRVIVDSSGSPLHGHIVSNLSGVEVAMIHLVRDVRAVAFSNQKRKPNPGAPAPGAVMKTKPFLRTSLTWLIYNYLLECLKTEFSEYELVRYERLFSSPKVEFEKLGRGVGAGKKVEETFERENKIDLTRGHMGQGNPTRFRNGVTELEKKSEWRREMSPTKRTLIKNICRIYLRRYSYI